MFKLYFLFQKFMCPVALQNTQLARLKDMHPVILTMTKIALLFPLD
jgi:hypothetical protein